MADALLTIQQLIDRFDGGAEALRRFAGDDGTGSYDAGKVAIGIAGASEEAYGILMSGFGSVERVQRLAANDAEVIDALAHLVRYRLTRFKDEFRLPDGRSVFYPEAREARDLLREKARAGKRTSAEEVTPDGPGQSGLLRPRAAHRRVSVLRDCNGRSTGF